jgi:hypothetical protein
MERRDAKNRVSRDRQEMEKRKEQREIEKQQEIIESYMNRVDEKLEEARSKEMMIMKMEQEEQSLLEQLKNTVSMEHQWQQKLSALKN